MLPYSAVTVFMPSQGRFPAVHSAGEEFGMRRRRISRKPSVSDVRHVFCHNRHVAGGALVAIDGGRRAEVRWTDPDSQLLCVLDVLVFRTRWSVPPTIATPLVGPSVECSVVGAPLLGLPPTRPIVY
jgi:hypothetical protein